MVSRDTEVIITQLQSSKCVIGSKMNMCVKLGPEIFFQVHDNVAEHEHLKAHRYKIIKKFSLFSGSDKFRMLFFMLTNVKMPATVGIFNIYGQKNFMLS